MKKPIHAKTGQPLQEAPHDKGRTLNKDAAFVRYTVSDGYQDRRYSPIFSARVR
jgi:hypothetical protein